MIGVISDTHGLVRPQAIEALRGSELIVHAGDVGSADVIEQLRAVAPTVAVRGNVDAGQWAAELPITRIVEAGRVRLYLLHDLATLDVDPKAAGCSVVISGHSHRPGARQRDGILYLNPGSAGPRRFSLPICVAKLQVDGDRVSHELIELRI
jgi:putative phosphoesterase